MCNHHVAVLAFPFATHAGLLLGLVQRVANSLPNVTFTFLSTSKSNSLIFTNTQNCNTNIKPFNVSDGVPEGYVLGGGGIEELIGLFFKSAGKNLRNAIAAAEDDSGKKITCVMADAFMWFSGEIAEELNVSWIPVWTSAAGSLSVHFYTDLIRENVGIEGIDGREDEILKFIPGFSELRLGDLPGGVVSGDLQSPFSVMLHKMGKTIGNGTAIPVNSFEELDPPIVQDLKSKFNHFLNVGPFNLTSPPLSANNIDKNGCIEWLDNQEPNSVVYIGFGTVATPPPNELKAMAEALEEIKIPFLWSIKENFMSHFPKGFLENTSEYGKIVPWAPQVQVLEHSSTGVFINHGGCNSVLESIASGVPIICRPFFGDHHLNSWMVEKVWRIGVKIEGGVFTKSNTMVALDLVLSKNREELKEQIGMYKDLALKAVGPSGSSTQNFKKLVEIITSSK
ncbi:kaempferol 3-O-beta-D-galactosyltransferase-like [Lycium ferocissimum]|uniref:kaempferol 3-O-beta-D-galactosyltransferase-like n=1 Tax=Lycium ferocissimum TaxID=112874 RepID=UPI002814F972|nr:kaempferol 3-O-beta-D-galactosyltransferase-like [Lycium ferocissimum]